MFVLNDALMKEWCSIRFFCDKNQEKIFYSDALFSILFLSCNRFSSSSFQINSNIYGGQVRDNYFGFYHYSGM